MTQLFLCITHKQENGLKETKREEERRKERKEEIKKLDLRDKRIIIESGGI